MTMHFTGPAFRKCMHCTQYFRAGPPSKQFCSRRCKCRYANVRTTRQIEMPGLEHRMDALHRRIKQMQAEDRHHPDLPEMRRHFVGMFNLLESGERR